MSWYDVLNLSLLFLITYAISDATKSISRRISKQNEIEENRLKAEQHTNELLESIQKELHKHNELLEEKYSNHNSN